MMAARVAPAPVLTAMLELGARPELVDHRGSSVLHYAMLGEDALALPTLLEAGVDIDSRFPDVGPGRLFLFAVYFVQPQNVIPSTKQTK